MYLSACVNCYGLQSHMDLNMPEGHQSRAPEGACLPTFAFFFFIFVCVLGVGGAILYILRVND